MRLKTDSTHEVVGILLVLYATLLVAVAAVALLSMVAEPGLATIHGWATVAVSLVWALVSLLYANRIKDRDW